MFFLCWESSVPTLHVYNSTNDWKKTHDPSCFLNSLIEIPNIPMATTCLTFPSQLPWADERCSSLSETTHLFCSLPMRGMQVTAGQCNSSHTHPSKLLSCFWEQRPSEGSAGHLPMLSPSYCFLLLGWQGNRTPANLISICFI